MKTSKINERESEDNFNDTLKMTNWQLHIDNEILTIDDRAVAASVFIPK